LTDTKQQSFFSLLLSFFVIILLIFSLSTSFMLPFLQFLKILWQFFWTLFSAIFYLPFQLFSCSAATANDSLLFGSISLSFVPMFFFWGPFGKWIWITGRFRRPWDERGKQEHRTKEGENSFKRRKYLKLYNPSSIFIPI